MCPHTVEVLSDNLMECLLDWNIDGKLCSLTVDNATINDAMVDILLDKLSNSLLLNGRLFHMHYCAQILNLIVKDGLDVTGESIERICNSVSYWKMTPKRHKKFMKDVRELKISSTKQLILDCKTRWNSTYYMLDTALVYKDVFSRLKPREPQYKSLPSEEDWEFAKEICCRLELFDEVTKLFSGTKYPTMNLYFYYTCEIRIFISKWLGSNNDKIRIMAKKMLEKYDKYWSVVNELMAVATVLDPRYKIKLVEY